MGEQKSIQFASMNAGEGCSIEFECMLVLSVMRFLKSIF